MGEHQAQAPLRGRRAVGAALLAGGMLLAAPAGAALAAPGTGPRGDNGGTSDNSSRAGGNIVRDQIRTARTTFRAGLDVLRAERREAKQEGRDAVDAVREQMRDLKQDFRSDIRDIKHGGIQ